MQRHRNISLVLIAFFSALLILANSYALRVTSSVRAYMNGESYYSKGQKDAARHLILYIINGDSTYYDSFLKEVDVPLGDRAAREALLDGKEDEVATAGFLRGKNHPDDVPQLIWLFKNFHNVSFMAEAIAVWTQADVLVGQLVQVANALHQSGGAKNFTIAEKQKLVVKVERLTSDLTVQEQKFAAVLSFTARLISQYIFYTNGVLILLLLVTAGQYYFIIIRRTSVANGRLKKTMAFGKFGSGTFDFKKGTGTLSRELLKILDLNQPQDLSISFEQFVQRFVLNEDQKPLKQKFYDETNGLANSTEQALEFNIRSDSGKIKLLSVKTVSEQFESFAIFQDITALRELENDSQKRAKSIEHILYSVTDGLFSVSKDWIMTLVNPAFKKYCGMHMDELLGRNLWEAFPTLLGTTIEEKYRVAMRTGLAECFQFSTDFKSTFEINIYPHDDGLLIYFRDVSETKRMLTALAEREQHLKQLLNGLPIGVYTTDATGVLTSFNEAAATLWGRTPKPDEKWCGSFKLFTLDGSYLAHDQCPMAVSVTKQIPVRNVEAIIERPNGERINFVAYTTPFYNPTGEFAGALNVMVDITERKRMEQALVSSEMHLRDLSDNLPDGAIISMILKRNSISFDYLYLSHGLDDVLKISADDIMQNSRLLNQCFDPFDLKMLIDSVRKSDNDKSFDVEFRLYTTSVGLLWANIRAKVVKQPNGDVLLNGLLLDITDRKQSEIKIEAQQQLSDIINHAQAEFIGNFDPHVTFQRVLQKLLTITRSEYGFIGETEDQPTGARTLTPFGDHELSCNYANLKASGHAQQHIDEPHYRIVFDEVLLSGQPVIYNQIAERHRSSLHHALQTFVGIPLKIGDELVGVIGLFNKSGYDDDLLYFLKPVLSFIAQLIQVYRLDAIKWRTEQEIKKLSLIASHTNNLVVFTTPDGAITWVNESFQTVTGYSLEEALGKKPGQLLQGEETDPEIVRWMSCRIKAGEEFRTEILNYAKGGRKYWLDIEVKPIHDYRGKLTGFMSVQSDITNLKLLVDEVEKARQQLQTIVDHAPMVVFMKDREGKYLFFNQRYKQDVNRMDLVPGMSDFEIFDADFAQRCRAVDRDIMERNEVLQYDHRVGNDDYIEMKFPISNSSGEVYALGGISIKVTETKALKKAVLDREERLHTLADNLSHGAIFQFEQPVDTAGHYSYYSSGIESLTGLKQEMILADHRVFNENIHKADLPLFEQKMEVAQQSLSVFDFEFRYFHLNGKLRWLHLRSRPLVKENGTIVWNGILVDVTESMQMRQQLEENQGKLEELLEEKDFLFREIHHRVKNNLQVISSVLFLKAQTLKDPAMRQLLMESRQRLRSMAFIHERLMQYGGHITQVDIHDYITGLIEEQKHVNGIDSEYTQVKLDVDRLSLNLEKAVNCGFIINEVFTNAVKYAFPLQTKGTISISFKSNEQACELKIKDNGVGLPEHVTLENDGLFGIQLVKVFTSHLGGTVKLDGTDGTEWTVLFHN